MSESAPEEIRLQTENIVQIGLPYYFRVLNRYKVLIILIFFASICGAFYISYSTRTEYESSTSFVVLKEQQSPLLMGIGQMSQLFGVDSHQSILFNYKTLLDSRLIALKVSKKLNLEQKLSESELPLDDTDTYQYLRKHVVVKDNSIISNSFEIVATAPNSELAADIADAYFYELKDYIKIHSRADATKNRVFLKQRLDEAKQKLIIFEDAKRVFLEKYKIAIDPDSQLKGEIDVYTKLEGELAIAESLLKASEKRRDEVRKMTGTLQNSPEKAPPKSSVVLPDIYKDLTITNIRNNLVQSEIDLFNAKQIYKDNNSKVLVIQAQNDEIGRRLEEEIKSVTTSLTHDLELEYITQSAKAEAYRSLISHYQEEFKNMPMISTDYIRFFRDVTVQSEVVKTLTIEYEKTLLEETKQTDTLEILDKAVPQKYPSRPKRRIILLFGSLTGICAGLFLSFSMDYIKRSYEAETRMTKSI